MNTTLQRLGKYELQELLGCGGMAEVWKAFDTQLHRSVAIKLLHANFQADPGFISRFTREAQMIAALRHTNIVHIYDFHISEPPEVDSTIAYMVMEYIEGQTLAHYIHATSRQQKFPPAADIVRLFTPISLAVDYAHQHGTIHRDIKPANILLDQSHRTHNPMGEPLLSDFGLAKLLSAPSQTITGMVFGTPLYISPEQVQNRAVSNRTDLYALGVILYEIFTGVTPFRGEGVDVMLKHLSNEPPDPQIINPNLSPELAAFLLKSIAKEPLDRFPSAVAMIAALAEALHLPIPTDVLETISSAPVIMNAEAVSANSNPVHLPDSATQLIAQAKNTANSDSAIESLFIKQTLPPRSRQSTSQQNGSLEPAVLPTPTLSQKSPVWAPTQPLLSLPLTDGRVKHRRLPFVLLAMLIVGICVLLGSGLGTFSQFTAHQTSTAPNASAIVGQAFFVSSGKATQTALPASNDEFQIDLQNIPNPQAGKSYCAWLLPDTSQSEAAPILLGTLAVNHGTVHFLYTGDSQHTNLLATTSRFLITEEAASITPSIPTPDLTAWRYYAKLPQTPAAGQTYSLLDHLRHLLANDPDLAKLHLTGGLNIWAYRNTQKILQWATNARQDWSTKDFASLHRLVIGMLDYLDGSMQVQQDVPTGTPFIANPQFAQVGLLELHAGQQEPGYLYHIELHLNGVLASPGATQYQRNLAIQINAGINNVRGWLEQVRSDAIQLVHMDNAHLARSSSLTLLNDVVTQTHNAFMGRKDPATSQLQQGMAQVYLNVQQLATFSVKSYS
jgi:eukaryotic-like serine/threonine-protein kinase